MDGGHILDYVVIAQDHYDNSPLHLHTTHFDCRRCRREITIHTALDQESPMHTRAFTTCLLWTTQKDVQAMQIKLSGVEDKQMPVFIEHLLFVSADCPYNEGQRNGWPALEIIVNDCMYAVLTEMR